MQRQRLVAARAAPVTTLPTPAAVTTAAHAELQSENNRLQEELNQYIGKCNELRERVWTLLERRKRDTASLRRAHHHPNAANHRTPVHHRTLADRRMEARRQESRRQQEARRHESRRRRETNHREPRLTPPPPPRSAKPESVLDRLVALHPLEEMES